MCVITLKFAVNCTWGQWNTWSTCSVTCGGGTQGRNRSIRQQALYGGNECIGEDNDTQTCNNFGCPGIGYIYVREYSYMIFIKNYLLQ